MSSNMFSRFLPTAGSPSVYEAIRQHDAESDVSDVEERAGMALEDESGDHFSDRELEEALADARESQMTSPSSPFLSQRRASGQRHAKAASRPSRSLKPSPSRVDADEGDSDVPPSLLIEGHEEDELLKTRFPPPPPPPPLPPHDLSDPEPPIPGPSTRVNRARWEATRAQQPIHPVKRKSKPAGRWSVGQFPNLAAADPREKAMWRWANVENLDNFLKDVYTYYLGNGIWSIMLSRALNLLYAIKTVI